MATTTQYYDLIKPEYSDDADIDDINDNMDTIVGALHDLADADDDLRELIGVIPEGSTVSAEISALDDAKVSKTAIATDAETAEMLDEVFGGGE